MINPEQKLTGGSAKIEEYVGRIQSGESSEEIMKGLPDSFRVAIEAKLNLKKDDEAKSKEAILSAQEARQETARMAQKDKVNSTNNANKIRIELGLPIQPDENILSPEEQKIGDLKKLSTENEKQIENHNTNNQELLPEKKVIIEAIKQKYNSTRLNKRMTLGDEMFMVSQGVNPENDKTFQVVDGKIGINYDAHGIAKSQQLDQLLNLLDNGINKDLDFYTAPFEVPADVRAGLASALGTSGGTAYKDGLAVLTSGYKEKMQDSGIKHVFINDVFSDLKVLLQEAYPQYQFHLLSEQKAVLEGEASKANK